MYHAPVSDVRADLVVGAEGRVGRRRRVQRRGGPRPEPLQRRRRRRRERPRGDGSGGGGQLLPGVTRCCQVMTMSGGGAEDTGGQRRHAEHHGEKSDQLWRI